MIHQFWQIRWFLFNLSIFSHPQMSHICLRAVMHWLHEFYFQGQIKMMLLTTVLFFFYTYHPCQEHIFFTLHIHNGHLMCKQMESQMRHHILGASSGIQSVWHSDCISIKLWKNTKIVQIFHRLHRWLDDNNIPRKRSNDSTEKLRKSHTKT